MISEKENLPLASFLAIPFLRGPFYEQQPVTPELRIAEFTLVTWVV